MSVGRDPADRLIDLAVHAPICAVLFVREAVPIAIDAGQRAAVSRARGLARIARRTVGDVRDEVGRRLDASNATGSAAPQSDEASDVGVAGEQLSSATGVSSEDLPIDDYDHLAARQVVDRLAALRPAELDLIESYESAHRHRRTILGKLAQLRSDS